jgi:hypothetical protein
MKPYKPTRTKSPHCLTPTELARVIGGDGDIAVGTLKQHVDNPGQTAMKG